MDQLDQEKIDWLLIVVIVFLGWLGIDKFYFGKKDGWKTFLVKLLATCAFVGVIWNIVDLIMALFKKYRLNPLYYIDMLEKNK